MVGKCMSDDEPDEALRLDLCTVACGNDADCEKFDSDQGKFVCMPDGDGRLRDRPTPTAARAATTTRTARATRGRSCVFSEPADARRPTRGPAAACAPGGRDVHAARRLRPRLPAVHRRRATGTSKPGCYPGYFGLPCTADDNCVGDLMLPAPSGTVADDLHGAVPDRRRLRRQPLDRRNASFCTGSICVPRRRRVSASGSRCQAPADAVANCAAAPASLGPRSPSRWRVAAGSPGGPARRRAEKIAVLVLATADKDAELADNLTEVIIAYAAQHGGFEIAGKEEFRARLGVESERRAQACLDDIACLGRAGVSLGVRRIVAGSVGTRGKRCLFNLNLDNVQDGRVESRVFRLVEGGVEDLIKAVQEASSELFRPRVEPGKIQVVVRARGRPRVDRQRLPRHHAADLADAASPASTTSASRPTDRFPWTSRVEVRPGEELQIRLTPDNLPRRRRWPGVRGVRVPRRSPAAAFAAGGFLGVLSQLQPNGDSRAGGDAGPRPEARRSRAAPTSRSAPARVLAAIAALPLHPLPRRHLRTYRAIRRYPLETSWPGPGPPLDAMGGDGYLDPV